MSTVSKISCLIILALVAILVKPQGAAAHFPASSGSIEAVLHIEPDDNPAPGQPETIYFIFSDSAGRFKLADCICNLAISSQNKLLYYAPLQPPPAGQPTVYSTAGIPFSYEPGLYDYKINARPRVAATFQAFSLSWSLPVSTVNGGGHGVEWGTFAAIFGLVLGVSVLLGGALFVLL